ncbi:hypothetical protein GRF29_164g1518961 [Pseudopithomyces chartarum]|uniref:Uncharacterized protein n=1 Tax=Pseudopithomyces chartarum TaxID=1892770 RepID=A0AAN6LQM1_9PLEO|nr:hypothetical protein GRF29_164g1518961 [Pseudopithomyces chartarum]
MPTLFKWSPRSDDSPASQSSSRFSSLHHNVRSIINGSSIYSQSPALPGAQSPKSPFLGFLRRDHSPPAPINTHTANNPPHSSDSRSPLHPPHTANSYMRSIGPFQDPQQPETVYRRDSDVPDRHPADVQLSGDGVVTGGGIITMGRARARIRAVSGDLSLALTRSALGQEIHILFIMILLATTIFFAHSLLRLCMLLLRPAPPAPPSLPNMMSEEGFNPVTPIRVHLARDEDLERGVDASEDDEWDESGEKEEVKMPPPAYGLWRSSVRVDPNLLHWRKVEEEGLPLPQGLGLRSSVMSSNTRNTSVISANRGGSAISSNTRNASVISSHTGVSSFAEGPRPPSYASDDGVEYVVEARARSMAPSEVAPGHSGVSDIHPAWRPGYAV